MIGEAQTALSLLNMAGKAMSNSSASPNPVPGASMDSASASKSFGASLEQEQRKLQNGQANTSEPAPKPSAPTPPQSHDHVPKSHEATATAQPAEKSAAADATPAQPTTAATSTATEQAGNPATAAATHKTDTVAHPARPAETTGKPARSASDANSHATTSGKAQSNTHHAAGTAAKPTTPAATTAATAAATAVTTAGAHAQAADAAAASTDPHVKPSADAALVTQSGAAPRTPVRQAGAQDPSDATADAQAPGQPGKSSRHVAAGKPASAAHPSATASAQADAEADAKTDAAAQAQGALTAQGGAGGARNRLIETGAAPGKAAAEDQNGDAGAQGAAKPKRAGKTAGLAAEGVVAPDQAAAAPATLALTTDPRPKSAALDSLGSAKGIAKSDTSKSTVSDLLDSDTKRAKTAAVAPDGKSPPYNAVQAGIAAAALFANGPQDNSAFASVSRKANEVAALSADPLATGDAAQSAAARAMAASLAGIAAPSTPVVQDVAQVYLPTPVNDPSFPQALSEQVSLFVTDEIKRADMVVSPPDMGPIRIELTLNGDDAKVVFTAAHPDTRHAIEQSSEVLRNMLAERGVSLGQMDVGQGGNQQQAFAGWAGSFGSGNGQETSGGRPAGPADPGASTAAPVGMVNRAAARANVGLLDLFA